MATDPSQDPERRLTRARRMDRRGNSKLEDQLRPHAPKAGDILSQPQELPAHNSEAPTYDTRKRITFKGIVIDFPSEGPAGSTESK